MDIQFTQRTLQNNKRRPNEDYSLHEMVGDANLFVIADGNDLAPLYIGSTPDLNVSRVACEQFIANCKMTSIGDEFPSSLATAFNETLSQVCKKIKDDEKHKYQSTTLTSLAVCNDTYFCMHVGDSALYHFSKASQAAVIVTPLPQKTDNVVFVEPGTVEHIKLFKHADRIEPGDFLLLTTDGLLHLWKDGLVDKLKELSMSGLGISEMVDCLFEKGKAVKGRDDLTCFVIRALDGVDIINEKGLSTHGNFDNKKDYNTSTGNNTPILDFYRGSANPDGQSLKDILYHWSDDDWETHGFIRLIFPLNEKSHIEPDSPILTEHEIEIFRQDKELQDKLFRSFRRFLHFLGLETIETGVEEKNDFSLRVSKSANFKIRSFLWEEPNHNWLRITRCLASLRILGLEGVAKSFYMSLCDLYEEFKTSDEDAQLDMDTYGVSLKDSFLYWKKVMEGPSSIEERNGKKGNFCMKKRLPVYRPKPIDTSGIVISADIMELAELLSESNHDHWAMKRFAEGWTYGHKRNDPDKKHPDLVPYKELSESEKEYDRTSSIETLKAIIALGYRIEKTVCTNG